MLIDKDFVTKPRISTQGNVTNIVMNSWKFLGLLHTKPLKTFIFFVTPKSSYICNYSQNDQNEITLQLDFTQPKGKNPFYPHLLRPFHPTQTHVF